MKTADVVHPDSTLFADFFCTRTTRMRCRSDLFLLIIIGFDMGFRELSSIFATQKTTVSWNNNPELNDHNKQEYPPMHSAEHILNATMVKIFGCPRSRNAHIERKKSKCDYQLASCPTDEQIAGY